MDEATIIYLVVVLLSPCVWLSVCATDRGSRCVECGLVEDERFCAIIRNDHNHMYTQQKQFAFFASFMAHHTHNTRQFAL
jgi:predicted Fe-S protein YdhL (DUF1289 family)